MSYVAYFDSGTSNSRVYILHVGENRFSDHTDQTDRACASGPPDAAKGPSVHTDKAGQACPSGPSGAAKGPPVHTDKTGQACPSSPPDAGKEPSVSPVLCMKKQAIGSKDSAIAGDNTVLLQGLWSLYEEALGSLGLQDKDIRSIYMSGMVTSPYGVKEVPHVLLPVSADEFADNLYRHHEDKVFHRDVFLVPGLKKADEDFSFVGNMRGEEIEILGTLDELRAKGLDKVALMLPGSHTHTAFIEDISSADPVIRDILSQFTGEVFHALKEETVLSPILGAELSASEIDVDMVRLAINNLDRFGFNRSMYICHAMRIMESGTPQQRLSYGEGVIMGGMKKAVEEYCRTRWQGCRTLAVVSDEFMFRLISIIFEGSSQISEVIHLPISKDKSYGVAGLLKILMLLEKT